MSPVRPFCPQQETFGPSRLPRSSDRSPGHLRIKRGYPVIFVHEFAGVGRRLRLRRRARPGRAVPRRGRGVRRTPGERGHGGQGRSHIRSITTPISSPTSALGSRIVSAPASSAWSRKAQEPSPEPTEAALETVLADYAGGIVPQELRIAVKDAYRAAQITQAQAATLLGLSRPHLAGRRVVPPPLQRPRAERLLLPQRAAHFHHPLPLVSV